MKKTLSIILAFCLFAAIATGCAPKAAEYDLDLLSDKLESSGAFSDILSEVELPVAAILYGFNEADIAEGKLLCSTGATTEEIGLFKCVDESAAAKVFSAAEARVSSQRSAYESYAPAEMPKLDEAIVVNDGVYVFYIVSADAEAAAAAMK